MSDLEAMNSQQMGQVQCVYNDEGWKEGWKEEWDAIFERLRVEQAVRAAVRRIDFYYSLFRSTPYINQNEAGWCLRGKGVYRSQYEGNNIEIKESHRHIPQWLYILWDESVRIIKWVLAVIALLAQITLRICLYFGASSGYPSRHRPACRTMPWDICPSLVVLWGVCWMFWNPPAVRNLNGQDVGDVALPNYESLETWSGDLFPWPPADIDWSAVESLPISTSLDQAENPFSVPDIDSFGSVQDLKDVLSFGPQAKQLRQYRNPDQGYHNIVGQPNVDITEKESQLAVYNTQSSESIAQPLSFTRETDPLISDAYGSAGDMRNGQNSAGHISNRHVSLEPALMVADQQLPVPASMPHPSAPVLNLRMGQVARVPEGYSSTTTTIEPSRNSEGRFICDREFCNEGPFLTRTAWKIHIDKHDHPYQCDVAGCPRSQGFGTKGDLMRHKRSKHPHSLSDSDSKPEFYCPVPTCNRSATSLNNPFVRRDHLQQHMKRVHKDIAFQQQHDSEGIYLASYSNQLHSSSDSVLTNPVAESSSVIPGNGKRKRSEERLPGDENANHEDDEEVRGLQVSDNRMSKRVKDLEAQCETFGQELDAIKRERETLYDVIRMLKAPYNN